MMPIDDIEQGKILNAGFEQLEDHRVPAGAKAVLGNMRRAWEAIVKYIDSLESEQDVYRGRSSTMRLFIVRLRERYHDDEGPTFKVVRAPTMKEARVVASHGPDGPEQYKQWLDEEFSTINEVFVKERGGDAVLAEGR